MYVVMYGFMQVLLVSSLCHTFSCLPRRISTALWKADYLAITCSIACMFYPFCWYCFACSSPAVKYTYISVTSCLGACITAVSLSDAFQSPALQPVRPMLFAGLAGWGLAPMAHAAWTLSSAPPVRLALQLTLAQMLLIALGAVLFATRFPERLRPGRFDLLLSSHQLFHILIVLAFVMYTQACLTLWRWRALGEGCGALL